LSPNPHRSPIYVPRWILTATYLGFVVLGVLAIIFGSPTLNVLNPHGYTLIWGVIATIGASIAAWGSMSDRREAIERWGNLIFVLDLIFYCLNALVLVLGDHEDATQRAVFTGIVLMLTALPLGRGVYLLTRTGVKHK
jgi:hypothetical protein